MTVLKILGKRGRITIPYEIRRKLGFKYNDILSFSEAADNTVIIKREKICNNCKTDIQVQNDSDINLLDFLNELTEAEQRAALIHLSVKWAERQGLENV